MRAMRAMSALLAICVSACSTPQVALDHANHGVALTSGLERELAEFERRQGVIGALRADLVEREKKSVMQLRGDFLVADQLYVATDQKSRLDAYRVLTELADARAKAARDEIDASKDLRAALDAARIPRPPARPKLAETGKALGALGNELSLEERLAIVTAFLSQVRAEIDRNRNAADAAEAAASGAAPAAPAPAPVATAPGGR